CWLGRFRSGSLSSDDDRRKSARRQHLVEDAEDRGEEVIQAELPGFQRALFSKRIRDVPGDDAHLVEEELLLHLEAGLAPLGFELRRLVAPKVAERAVEIAEELLIERHKNYQTASVRDSLVERFQHGAIIFDVFQHVEEDHTIRGEVAQCIVLSARGHIELPDFQVRVVLPASAQFLEVIRAIIRQQHVLMLLAVPAQMSAPRARWPPRAARAMA